MVYQMDVKSTFLNGEIEEEVYIEKHEYFQLSKNSKEVCRLKKDYMDLSTYVIIR